MLFNLPAYPPGTDIKKTLKRIRRRGLSLLEVMIAMAILVPTMVILVEIQANSAVMAIESQRYITATDLAQTKITESLVRMEKEGFGDMDLYESGEFDDFGDEVLSAEFGSDLEDYHWEYWVSQIDIGMAGDLSEMAGNLQGQGIGGTNNESPAGASTGADPMQGLSSMGLSSELLTEQISKYIREVRVRVWWGKDSDDAEKAGREVILTTHVINPNGQVIPGANTGQVPAQQTQ